MFWKLGLGLGFFGLMVSLIIIVVSVNAFYDSTETTEDIAFAGLIIGILLLIGSFLLTIVSLFFVMRSSKKKWEAENPKTDNLK